MILKKMLVLSLLTLGSCTVLSPQNAVFYANIDNEHDQYVDVFVDGYGDIYPNAGFPSDPLLMGKPNNATGSILNQALHPESQLCANENVYGATEAELLCDALPPAPCNYNVTFPCDIPPAWTKAQQQLWENRGKEIYQMLLGSDKDEVLFLVHGFNNDYTDSNQWYEAQVISRVRNLGHDPVVVRVFWDGFKNGVIGGSWGMAQVTGPLVGFKLRQLFNAFNAQVESNNTPYPKIRAFTHSSGAYVLASTFGNMYTVLPMMYDPDRRDRYYAELVQYRANMTDQYFKVPHFADLRLGMIAPATPPNTFNGISNNPRSTDYEHQAGTLTSNTTILMSINWKDKILNKYLGLSGINLLGNTVLGTDQDDYCAFMAPLPVQKDNIDAVYAFDFRGPGFRNGHGVSSYFSHEGKASDFINLLFAQQIPSTHLITCQ